MRSLAFRVLAAAELEVFEAATWYADQRAELGDQFLAEVAATFDRIRDERLLHPRLEQLRGP